MRAPGRASRSALTTVEAAAVAEPQIDDREGRRMRGRGGDPGGDPVGGRDDKPAPLHRTRQALAQRRIVIDDQQRALGFGQPAQRGRGPASEAVGRGGSIARVHHPLPLHCRGRAAARDARAPMPRHAGRACASKLARFQEMTTWAPPSARLSKASVGAAALEQALRDEDAEPHVVRGAGAGRQIGLAEPAQQMHRETRPVVGDLDRDRRSGPRWS